MKKNILFAAAVVSMVAFASCSKSEGENAANDESVAGATDGMEVIEESATEIEAPAVETPEVQPVEETVAVETTEAQDNKTIVDKAKDVYEKGKDVVNEGVDKSKEAYQKSKEAVKEGVEKGKELLNKVK